ncbi:DNA-binding transcriptional regulator, LysR family [Pseudomonas sp. NFACC02]|uniref:LysR family transcriptional regulator n=1 Tax=Pseudomonas sp. NFACC02 TaxID=1566250 RepID=UPI0008BD3D3F|nr:LysR family transcriptional regulator [Pseudomonas sp. NFACC02]SER28350.1 DNA-binding transcriptional regulator, LysR family [Pseudomonas sp. NFACC02]
MINAAVQYRLNHADLALILALVRGRTLARAAELLSVDVSTVFRSVRRLEACVGTELFEKSRAGYQPSSAAIALSQQAQSAEQALALAQISLEQGQQIVSGTVRLTCTEAVLQSLLLPALRRFMPDYPGLQLELNTSSTFANLSRRDADIALRLTNTPPEHLVGTRLGTVSYHVCASEQYLQRAGHAVIEDMCWVAPDDFLPDHPTVTWRRQHWPRVNLAYRCSSMLGVAQLVRAGMGVAALPDFMLREGDLQRLGEPLAGYDTALWLLTRPDCRALRSVSALFSELTRNLALR